MPADRIVNSFGMLEMLPSRLSESLASFEHAVTNLSIEQIVRGNRRLGQLTFFLLFFRVRARHLS